MIDLIICFSVLIVYVVVQQRNLDQSIHKFIIQTKYNYDFYENL